MSITLKTEAVAINFDLSRIDTFKAQLKEFTLDDKRAEDFASMVMSAVVQCETDLGMPFIEPIAVWFMPDQTMYEDNSRYRGY